MVPENEEPRRCGRCRGTRVIEETGITAYRTTCPACGGTGMAKSVFTTRPGPHVKGQIDG